MRRAAIAGGTDQQATLVANAWIKPMRQWLNQASDLNAIVKTVGRVSSRRR